MGQIDRGVPVSDIRPMEIVVSRSIAQASFISLIMLLSAIIALALSAVGLYGVISYVVGQRRAEIGIRMALGARAADVTRLVMQQSLVLAGTGIVVGVLAALGTSRLLTSLLFDVSPSDPTVLIGSCCVLLAAAAVASFGPTRRATRIDPVEAMRAV